MNANRDRDEMGEQHSPPPTGPAMAQAATLIASLSGGAITPQAAFQHFQQQATQQKLRELVNWLNSDSDPTPTSGLGASTNAHHERRRARGNDERE